LDPFQSQPAKKLVRVAKAVHGIQPGKKGEVVPGENLNAIAWQFIRAWKRQRAVQGSIANFESSTRHTQNYSATRCGVDPVF